MPTRPERLRAWFARAADTRLVKDGYGRSWLSRKVNRGIFEVVFATGRRYLFPSVTKGSGNMRAGKKLHVHRAPEAEELPLEHTLLFKRWESMKEDILRHKWYESEKAGHDVGWVRAATNWMLHHHHRFDSENPIPGKRRP